MNKHQEDPLSPEPSTKIASSSYRHYLGIVKILERLHRQRDLEFGPRLMNKIIDARQDSRISDEQTIELTDRIHAWCQKLEDHFASQEYQMKKLMLAIEQEERRNGEKTSTT